MPRITKPRITKKRRRRRSGRKRGKFLSTKMKVEFVYRSGWELSYYQFLDSAPQVKEYFVEPFKIPYVYRKKSRNYIPDVLIKYVDGTVELVEIKPSNRVDRKVNIAKFDAARTFCIANGYSFQIITEKDLKVLKLL